MELAEWMTVDQSLAGCRPLYPKWDTDLERSLRKQFALPSDRKLKHLSLGGQRMKAALIAALAYRPELLVLDEPFSSLDPLVRDEFITGLLELADGEGFTVWQFLAGMAALFSIGGFARQMLPGYHPGILGFISNLFLLPSGAAPWKHILFYDFGCGKRACRYSAIDCCVRPIW